MRSLKNWNTGFTILELILAAALGVVVLGGAYMVYEAGWSTVGRSERKADLQQNLRAAMDMLQWQIRLAGYQNGGTAQNRIAIADTNLVVIRGDVLVTGVPAPPDTLFGLLAPGAGVCPNLPASPATPLPCLVTGPNFYAVGGAPTVVAFNAVTTLAFTYFDGLGNQLLPTPLDGVAAGAFPDGVAAPSPLPAPTTNRDAVRMIRIALTAVDARVSAGPGMGSEVEQITLTTEVRFRNAD